MKRSENYKEIVKSVFLAQSQIEQVVKNAVNSFYNSAKYSTYDVIKTTIQPVLTGLGLWIEHTPSVDYRDIEAVVIHKQNRSGDEVETTQVVSIPFITMITRVTHIESDQWIEEELTYPCDKCNSHGIQACISYMKRQNMILIFDIATKDDDDGNAGVISPDEYQQVTGSRPRGTGRRPPLNSGKTAFTTGSGKPVNMQQATSGLKSEDLEPQPGDLPFGDGLPGVGQMNDDHPPYHDNERVELNSNEQPSQKVDPARPMTDTERKRLGIVDKKMVDGMTTVLKAKGIPPEKMFPYLENVWGYKTIGTLKVSDYKPIMDVIEKHPEEIMNFVPEVE